MPNCACITTHDNLIFFIKTIWKNLIINYSKLTSSQEITCNKFVSFVTLQIIYWGQQKQEKEETIGRMTDHIHLCDTRVIEN